MFSANSSHPVSTDEVKLINCDVVIVAGSVSSTKQPIIKESLKLLIYDILIAALKVAKVYSANETVNVIAFTFHYNFKLSVS